MAVAATLRSWLRSPTTLRLLVGQHIINGASVAAGVMAIGVGASALIGFPGGQVASLGAIAASISDLPAPWRVKARTMLTGFALALISTSSVLAAERAEIPFLVVIALIAFGSGMITGLGRWAMALGMQALVPMVFVLGLPPETERSQAEVLFAAGGFAYVAVGLLLTRLTDASTRRMVASECFRELASYVRAVAAFFDDDADIPESFGVAIRRQAALSEQIQMARALLLERAHTTPERVRLAATIGVMLDVFDRLIAAVSGLRTLRGVASARPLRRHVALALRVGARDLSALGLDLLAHGTPRLPVDHSLARDALSRERAALQEAGDVPEEARAAIDGIVGRVVDALSQVRRLERVLTDDAEAKAALAGVDLGAFLPRRTYALSALFAQITPNSAVFRFAVRLALAMTAGGIVALSLGGENHGNWVLLTIAVILRPQYGLTRERRDDRVVGTLIGCLIAAGLVAYVPTRGLVVVQAVALAVTHGFGRINYRLASAGASAMALVTLHLVAPQEPAPIVVRLADTLIGAAIAHLFNFVWPLWESNQAPKHAERLSEELARFAACALDPDSADNDYRLRRKAMIEGIAALSDSAARMDGEPAGARKAQEELTALLIPAYRLTVHTSAARLRLRDGPWREGRDAAAAERGAMVEALANETPPAAAQPEFALLWAALSDYVSAARSYRAAFAGA